MIEDKELASRSQPSPTPKSAGHDLSALSDEDLRELLVAIMAETGRRQREAADGDWRYKQAVAALNGKRGRSTPR